MVGGYLFYFLAELCLVSVNTASVHSRGFWGHAPPGNFGDFRCSEVHSGAI